MRHRERKKEREKREREKREREGGREKERKKELIHLVKDLIISEEQCGRKASTGRGVGVLIEEVLRSKGL